MGPELLFKGITHRGLVNKTFCLTTSVSTMRADCVQPKTKNKNLHYEATNCTWIKLNINSGSESSQIKRSKYFVFRGIKICIMQVNYIFIFLSQKSDCSTLLGLLMNENTFLWKVKGDSNQEKYYFCYVQLLKLIDGCLMNSNMHTWTHMNISIVHLLIWVSKKLPLFGFIKKVNRCLTKVIT